MIENLNTDDVEMMEGFNSVDIKKDDVIWERNGKLRQSDFSQGADAPDYVKAKLSEWNAYRQALRDITNQTGFPWDVTFPQQPTK